MTNRGSGGHDLTVFSIAPQRLGGMDLVIPLFHALKGEEPNCRIHLVFFEDRPYRQVTENEFYRTEIEGLVDSILLLPPLQPGAGVFRYATAWLARLRGALQLIAGVAATKRPLLLHSRQLTTRLLRLVNRIVKARGGRVLGHAALQTISFDRVPKKRIDATLVGDGYLGFGEGEIPYLRASGHDRVFLIGYPKLFSHWTARIRKDAPAWVRTELTQQGIAADKPIVLVLMGSVVPGIYDRDESEAWLRQVIAVIGRALPDHVTILKPHPAGMAVVVFPSEIRRDSLSTTLYDTLFCNNGAFS